jgi:hypothetical protein
VNVVGLCVGNPTGYAAFHQGRYAGSGTQRFSTNPLLAYRLWLHQHLNLSGYDAVAIWTPSVITDQEHFRELVEQHGPLLQSVSPREVREQLQLRFPTARDYLVLARQRFGACESYPEALALFAGWVLSHRG